MLASIRMLRMLLIIAATSHASGAPTPQDSVFLGIQSSPLPHQPRQEPPTTPGLFWFDEVFGADRAAEGLDPYTPSPVTQPVEVPTAAPSVPVNIPVSLAATPTTGSLSSVTSTMTMLPPMGPGLVVPPPSVFGPEDPPKVEEFTETQQETASAHHPYPAPVSKLLVIGGVFGALAGITLIAVLLKEYRALCCCCTRQPSVARAARPRMGTSKRLDSAIPIPSWLRFIPPSLIEKDVKATSRAAPTSEKVVDITSETPRSKFSVTSSDYPFSLGSFAVSSSSSTASSINSSPVQVPVFVVEDCGPSALLSPAEFFSLPSISSSQDFRHLRTSSAPSVIGKQIIESRPSSPIHNDQSRRRSRSVLGLVNDHPSYVHRKTGSR